MGNVGQACTACSPPSARLAGVADECNVMGEPRHAHVETKWPVQGKSRSRPQDGIVQEIPLEPDYGKDSVEELLSTGFWSSWQRCGEISTPCRVGVVRRGDRTHRGTPRIQHSQVRNTPANLQKPSVPTQHFAQPVLFAETPQSEQDMATQNFEHNQLPSNDAQSFEAGYGLLGMLTEGASMKDDESVADPQSPCAPTQARLLDPEVSTPSTPLRKDLQPPTCMEAAPLELPDLDDLLESDLLHLPARLQEAVDVEPPDDSPLPQEHPKQPSSPRGDPLSALPSRRTSESKFKADVVIMKSPRNASLDALQHHFLETSDDEPGAVKRALVLSDLEEVVQTYQLTPRATASQRRSLTESTLSEPVQRLPSGGVSQRPRLMSCLGGCSEGLEMLEQAPSRIVSACGCGVCRLPVIILSVALSLGIALVSYTLDGVFAALGEEPIQVTLSRGRLHSSTSLPSITEYLEEEDLDEDAEENQIQTRLTMEVLETSTV